MHAVNEAHSQGGIGGDGERSRPPLSSHLELLFVTDDHQSTIELRRRPGAAPAAAMALLAASRRERSTGADFCVVASRKLGVQLNLARTCIAVSAARFYD